MQKKSTLLRLFLLSLVLLPQLALAQETPKLEISGGYSYLRLTPNTPGDRPANNNHGYFAEISGNLERHFGITASFTRHYGSSIVPAQLFVGGAASGDLARYRVKSASLSFGPRFSWRTERTTLFGQLLLGGSRTHFIWSANSASSDGTFPGLVIVFGGGLDINMTRYLAFRAGQVEYQHIKHVSNFPGAQNNLRYATGLVVRLGQR